MSLVCAVPSYAEMAAATGQDVIVIGSGLAATRLRLDGVLPVQRGAVLSFRALLTGDPGAEVRNGTHLARVGDYLVRLRLVRQVADDGSEHYEAQAQAHLDQVELELAAC